MVSLFPERLAMTKSMFYPLAYFYQELQVPPPEVMRATPSELPEWQNRLLVHDRDMTPTLESAYNARVRLRVLRYAVTDETLDRLITLALDGDETPVIMGAIHIFLTRLPSAARERVVAMKEPFGRILQETGVIHHSRPVAYFGVTADSVIMDALGMIEPSFVYGRRSAIWNAAGEELADVVEILPPSRNTNHGRVS
jgi:chorismate-pyruvate lyase